MATEVIQGLFIKKKKNNNNKKKNKKNQTPKTDFRYFQGFLIKML